MVGAPRVKLFIINIAVNVVKNDVINIYFSNFSINVLPNESLVYFFLKIIYKYVLLVKCLVFLNK